MTGITYQEAVAQIDRCIAYIRTAAKLNENFCDQYDVDYLAYELDQFMADKGKGVKRGG